MGCQTAISGNVWALSVRLGITLALSLSAHPGAAYAHETGFTFHGATGTGALVDIGIRGQYGFFQKSRWFLYGEATRWAIPGNPREDHTRFGFEGGFEARRIGLSLRSEFTTNSGTLTDTLHFGGTLRLRFLTWASLSREEEIQLSRSDRLALLESREREVTAQAPTAPVLLFSYGFHNLSSPFLSGGGTQVTNIGAHVVWKLRPWWLILPGFHAFVYLRPPRQDIGQGTVYSSRHFRWVRVGPRGPVSSTFGAPNSYQQLFQHFELDSIFSLDVGLTRTQIDPLLADAYSLWLGFNRRFGAQRKWIFNPVYEHLKVADRTFIYIAVMIKRELSEPFAP